LKIKFYHHIFLFFVNPGRGKFKFKLDSEPPLLGKRGEYEPGDLARG